MNQRIQFGAMALGRLAGRCVDSPAHRVGWSWVRLRRLARIGLSGLLVALAALSAWPDKAHVSSRSGNPALADLLNPDRTLNQARGFSGSLDASGYRMEYTPSNAPRFVPLPASDDDNWDAQFTGSGTSKGVRAIAVIGSDLYVGGDFSTAGGMVANHIAKWNGNTWSALGGGVNNPVLALAAIGSDLYVGGSFTTAGGVSASGIAKWDGSSWSALASGVNGNVSALAVIESSLYVGGSFTTAGGGNASNVAKWNGSNWSALGGGVNSGVSALAVNGNALYVGGGFSTAGGISASKIAKWEGNAWSALGGNISRVNALAVIGNDLYLAGRFTVAFVTVNGIIKWDGNAWSDPIISFGDGREILTLTVGGSELYAGGSFDMAGGVSVSNIAKWNGSSWSALGSGIKGTNGYVGALRFIGGNLYAGGFFSTAGGASASNIAKWNGSAWSALGSGNGLSPIVRAIAINGNDVYVGGSFTTAGGVIANNVAKWNGSTWSALGSGVNNPVYALAVIGGDLYAGGNFTTAGGVSANRIAKWNGSTWSALGSGVGGSAVYALDVMGSDLYVGGNFTTAGGASANFVAKWNGSAWSALGSGVNNIVYAVKATGGNLYVGGLLTAAGGTSARAIAKWNGSAWSALGAGFGAGYNESYVYAIADNGNDLYVGGTVYTQFVGSRGYIAKWNGSVWASLNLDASVNEGKVAALAVKDSDLYVGGYFNTAGGVSASNIARWNGSAWSPLGSGVSEGLAPTTVYALGANGNGLYVGGDFTIAGGKPSSYFGRYSICATPSIITQPVSQSVTTGSSVTFSITATGTAPLSYQWRKDGSNLSGATNSSYTIASATLTNAGSYDVVVTNGCGTVNSNVVTLTVNAAPVITEPTDGNMVAGLVTIRATGGTGNLTLEVQGTMPVTPTLTPPSGLMAGGMATWNVSSINDGDKFAITVKDANNVSSATVNVTVKPLIEVKLRIVDGCDANNAWNLDKVPTTGSSLSYVTLSNSGLNCILPVDSQGRFTTKNMLNCTEASLTGPISLNSSADLHYNDHITVNSGGARGCDAPGVVPRTAKANGQSVAPTQGRPTISNIDFPVPIFLIHGIESCYQTWDEWVSHLNTKGYIAFTPNHEFIGKSQRDYAVQTASQIYTDLSDLLTQPTAPEYYIIAHSQGGVVSRVATYEDERVRNQLKRIYTLGTPHSGTLAPVFPGAYGLDSFFMRAFFNSKYPGFKYRDGSTNIPTDFVFAIGGTGGLFGWNDGIVYPQSSVFGIYGLIGTYQSFSEHQAEREFPFVHMQLTGQATICDILERTILADMRCQSPAACSSALLADTASSYRSIADRQNRRLSVQSSLQTITPATSAPVGYQTLTLSAGQTQTASFPISSASAATFICNPLGITTATSITTPSGIVITASNASYYPGVTYEDDAFGQRYTVRSPQAGNWTIQVTAGSQSGTAYLGAVEQATWQLEGSPDRAAYAAAAPVILQGRLTGNFNNVTSVSSVTATVMNSSGATMATSTLFDDGLHNDAAAGDKVYGNSINSPSTAGTYQVVIQADGVAQGNPFRRQTLSRFDVIPSTHLFTGAFSTSALDTNGDTKFDKLDETVGLNVPAAGQYTVSADLFDGNGNLIDHAVQTISPTAAGVQQAVLRFSLFNPSCSSFTSGLRVKNLSIADAINSLMTLDLWTTDINVTGFTDAQFGCTGAVDANLVVSISVGPNPVSAGNAVTYTVTVSNAGPSSASAVNVANNLPAMTTLASCAATNGGVCGGVGYSSASVTFPTLASGTSATITLVAALNVAVPNGATLTMASSVTAATTDTNPNNNTTTATTQVSNATVPIIAEFSPTSSSPGVTVAISGTRFTGTTSVKFNGTNAIFNVVNANLILATVPAGATTGPLAVMTPNGTVTSNSNFVVCVATLDLLSQSFGTAGGTGSVNVSAGTGCSWLGTSNAAWITITFGTNGNGNGVVNYTVAPNLGPQRTGTMTIAGQTFTVTQNSGCAAITLTPTVLLNGTVGLPYLPTSFTATGTNGSVTFSLSGTLPAGMSLVGSQLAGTPTQQGSFPIIVTATDAYGCSTSRNYTLVVNCPTIITSPGTIPIAQINMAYPAQTFTASGGNAPYTINLTGVLPIGMSFSGGTLSGTPTQPGDFSITINVTDQYGCTASRGYTLKVNRKPVALCQNIIVTADATCNASADINNGSGDPDGDTLTITQSPAGPYVVGTRTVTLTVDDGRGGVTTCTATVTVNPPKPVPAITSPVSGAIYSVGTPVSFTGTFTDLAGTTHTATWAFDNITQAGTVNETSGAVTATHTFTAAGVYLVTLTVSNGCGGTGTANTVDGLTALVVIYDPNGGFVTGGGWINSPAGAYTTDPSLFGKASFGFVSKYQPGATVPTGNTEFQFRVANFNFKSASYDWLVVAGARAQFKGSGTINGSGDYSFILTAIDGQINGGGGMDKFRIKIWDKGSGGVVYDNQLGGADGADPTTIIEGGSIVIHK